MQSDFIKKPKIYVYVSLLWFIMWGLITAIVFLQMLSDGDYTYLFTCFLFLITIIHSIYSLIYTINFSIKILDEKVIITNWIRRKKIYNINELYIKWKRDSFIVYKGGRRLARISKFDQNFEIITKNPYE